jgi:hypothetical protein
VAWLDIVTVDKDDKLPGRSPATRVASAFASQMCKL